MTPGEAMELKMLEALQGTFRTWCVGYPIRFITLTSGERLNNAMAATAKRTRKQYRPRSKVFKKRKLTLVVNNG